MKSAPALHRSVWFWLGCFVLVFLVWAWVDSERVRTSYRRVWGLARVTGPGQSEFVGYHVDGMWLDDGRLYFNWTRSRVAAPAIYGLYQSMKWSREPRRGNPERPVMPLATRERTEPTPGATVVTYRVEVPVWGVTGLYVMVCGGAVWWQRRRWRKFLLDEGGSEEMKEVNS